MRAIDSELFAAITRNDKDGVKRALTAGADPNAEDARDINCDHALHRAAQLTNPAIAIMLIRAGANMEETNGTDSTPLILAAFRGCARTVQALLIHQADVTASNAVGNTALHCAVTVEGPFDDGGIGPLLRAGSDVRKKNHAKKNVPEFAASIGDVAAGVLHQEVDALGDMLRPAFVPSGTLDRQELFKTDGKGWELTPKNIGFWQQFDVILDRLAEQGEPITHDDLMWKQGTIPLFDEHLLEEAHSYYQLPKALSALAAHGIHLEPSDLVVELGGNVARSFVQELAEFGALDQLFVAENWEGVSSRQIRACYQTIKQLFPEEAAEQITNAHALIANAAKSERLNAQSR